MSSIQVLGNPSGGGDLQLKSPATAVSRTQTFPDEDGTIVAFEPYRLICTDSPGNASTNTAVRRFTTILTQVGNGLTFTQSSTLGDSLTCVQPGRYAISFNTSNTTNLNFGLTRNASGTELTTANFATILAPTRLALAQAGANAPARVTWVGWLAVGDVVRAQVSSGGALTAGVTDFQVERVS